jgi:hypothetical protein
MRVKSCLKKQAPDPGRQHFSSIFAMQSLDESNHTINLISGKDVSAFPLISKSLYKYDQWITH